MEAKNSEIIWIVIGTGLKKCIQLKIITNKFEFKTGRNCR